jgi:hypothetical protein
MSRVIARPRDVCRGMDPVVVCWVKRRWACEEEQCPRQTFTESVPHLRPRCRITTRLREQAGAELAGRGIALAEAALARRRVLAGGPRSVPPRRRTRCWISRTRR